MSHDSGVLTNDNRNSHELCHKYMEYEYPLLLLTTVIFRTTLTRTIIFQLLMKNKGQFWITDANGWKNYRGEKMYNTLSKDVRHMGSHAAVKNCI